MKGLDILIVRFLPFILYIILGINIALCWSCNDIVLYFYELHGNSVLYALGFFLVSLANKRYHCVWNRAMYAYLIFVPCLNFLDACFGFMSSDSIYLGVVLGSYGLTALITAYLAICHFVNISKKKIDNERR